MSSKSPTIMGQASVPTLPQRSMTAQHRKNLSRSMRNLWAGRKGLSSEHRQKISDSVVKWWAKRKWTAV
jgi:hypothetical protein